MLVDNRPSMVSELLSFITVDLSGHSNSIIDSDGLKNDERFYYCPDEKIFLPDRYVEGKCPNCGAYLELGKDNYCDQCGMKFSFCPYCHEILYAGQSFCTKCGRPVDQEEATSQSSENKAIVNKKALNAFFAVIGLLILIVLGSIFYSDYSEKREARIAREHFVEDSIRKAKIEEERLQMEEELRIKAEKEFAQFLNDFTISKLIDLVSNPTDERYAQRCGLSQVYRIATEEEYGEDLDIVYGRAIEKGNKLDYGYQLVCNSEHSCYFRYWQATSSGAQLCFKNQEDANLFWKKAIIN